MTEPRAPLVHWLRGNKGEKTPRQVIILDTESQLIETEPRELHGLRCWVARFVVRGPEPGQIVSCEELAGTTNPELVDAIESWVKSKASWRLFTHNLSYDLGLTRLPLELIGRGWTVGRHNLASNQPWAHMSRRSRSLWLCDSWSWLPASVETLGELLGIPKFKLPDETDPLEIWTARCRRDVEIQSAALLQLLDEWDRRALGWWSITGPASGWNTLLHFPARSWRTQEEPRIAHSENPHAKTGGERVLIVPDPQARAFERQSLYSGRRDVWKVGQLSGGPWVEVDLRNAHLSICARLPLPYRRWAAFDSLPLGDWRLSTDGAGLVAQVVVRTSTPRYPLRHRGAVLHPTGQFQTVLAGPEIVDARLRGELVSIGHGYGYHLGEQMKGWAEWCLGVLNTDAADISPMLRVAVKAWGRSVPGRWGMTHARDIKSGPSHVKDWALEQITVGNPPRRGNIFHLAGTWTESVSDQEAEDSFPAVLAYIQSYCRLLLNRMLDAIPADALVSCNTEGAWVTESGLCDVGFDWRPDATDLGVPVTAPSVGVWALSEQTAPLEVRVKQTTHRLKVLSPQHHETDSARLYSGIPRAATLDTRGRYVFQTWPKLKGQIERGDPRGYVRERRTVSLAGLPVSRWAFEDGACEPVAACWSPQTGNTIQPPSEAQLARHGRLRAVQHPVLRRVLK